MKKKIEFRSQCPISTALDIFGDKWTLLVIRDLVFTNKQTYGEFLGSNEKIATNILADRLCMLETAGIISRTPHPESKAKVLYQLTPKGVDLIPILAEIIVWSDKYQEIDPYAKKLARSLKRNKAEALRDISQGKCGF